MDMPTFTIEDPVILRYYKNNSETKKIANVLHKGHAFVLKFQDTGSRQYIYGRMKLELVYDNNPELCALPTQDEQEHQCNPLQYTVTLNLEENTAHFKVICNALSRMHDNALFRVKLIVDDLYYIVSPAVWVCGKHRVHNKFYGKRMAGNVCFSEQSSSSNRPRRRRGRTTQKKKAVEQQTQQSRNATNSSNSAAARQQTKKRRQHETAPLPAPPLTPQIVPLDKSQEMATTAYPLSPESKCVLSREKSSVEQVNIFSTSRAHFFPSDTLHQGRKRVLIREQEQENSITLVIWPSGLEVKEEMHVFVSLPLTPCPKRRKVAERLLNEEEEAGAGLQLNLHCSSSESVLVGKKQQHPHDEESWIQQQKEIRKLWFIVNELREQMSGFLSHPSVGSFATRLNGVSRILQGMRENGESFDAIQQMERTCVFPFVKPFCLENSSLWNMMLLEDQQSWMSYSYTPPRGIPCISQPYSPASNTFQYEGRYRGQTFEKDSVTLASASSSCNEATTFPLGSSQAAAIPLPPLPPCEELGMGTLDTLLPFPDLFKVNLLDDVPLSSLLTTNTDSSSWTCDSYLPLEPLEPLGSLELSSLTCM